MEYKTENSITVRFEDEEVDKFVHLIDVSHKELSRPGYKKHVPRELGEFINMLYQEFVEISDGSKG